MEEEQRTVDWYKARLGHFTGSEVGTLMQSSREKDKLFGKDATKYIYQIVAERTMNSTYIEDNDMFNLYLSETNVETKAMQLGTQKEKVAREVYSKFQKCNVFERGFIEHPAMKYYGASPDGVITDNDKEDGNIVGGIEIKSVGQVNFIMYKNECKTAADLKKINSKYYYQVISEIAVTGAKWWDFVVFCPYQKDYIYAVHITREEIEDDLNLLCSRIVLAEEAAKVLIG